MVHEISFSGENGRLSLGGSLTIESTSTLKNVLVDALGATSRLELDLSRVTSTTVTCCLFLTWRNSLR